MNGLRILDRGAAGWLIDDFSSPSFAAPLRVQPTKMHRAVTVRNDDRKGLASRLPGLFAQVTLRPILGIPSSGPGYADRDGETDPLGAGGMRCRQEPKA